MPRHPDRRRQRDGASRRELSGLDDDGSTRSTSALSMPAFCGGEPARRHPVRVGGWCCRMSRPLLGSASSSAAGPNGSGKTTLLRAILGLVRPTPGDPGHDRPPARGNPATAICRKASARSPICGPWPGFRRQRGQGQRWGSPHPDRRRSRRRRRGARIVERGGDWPSVPGRGAVGRRTAAADAGAGLARQAPACSCSTSRWSTSTRDISRSSSSSSAISQRLGIAVLFSAHELNPLLDALDRVLYLGGGRRRSAPWTRS